MKNEACLAIRFVWTSIAASLNILNRFHHAEAIFPPFRLQSPGVNIVS